MLAGTDNDCSVLQIAGSATQCDVYFKSGSSHRVQCDIGSFDNCVVMNTNGSLGADVGAGFSSAGDALLPGVLPACKASAADLAGYTPVVPEPGTYALMLAGVGLVGWVVARRRAR